MAETEPGLRVWVVGTSGSGKSTFAEQLAARAGVAHLELDLINWRPGWHDRTKHEPQAFLADVEAATAGTHWVIAGGYSMTQSILLPRLTDMVWLDLPLLRVMGQVIDRSVRRAASDRDVFPGCREGWLRLLRADHPIRWALSTHKANQVKFAERARAAAALGARVWRCRTRAEVGHVLDALTSLR